MFVYEIIDFCIQSSYNIILRSCVSFDVELKHWVLDILVEIPSKNNQNLFFVISSNNLKVVFLTSSLNFLNDNIIFKLDSSIFEYKIFVFIPEILVNWSIFNEPSTWNNQ